MLDGRENLDRDGKLDVGEVDPREPADDGSACSLDVPPGVVEFRVTRLGAAAHLACQAFIDPCTAYVVLATEALPIVAESLRTSTSPSGSTPRP